jgi:hypothetical protein
VRTPGQRDADREAIFIRTPKTSEWMALAEAYRRVFGTVGGHDLAAEVLRQHLVSGEIKAQFRVVVLGEGITIKPLTPEDFKGRAVHANHARMWFDGLDEEGNNILVRRADVNRIWPVAAEKPTAWLTARAIYERRLRGDTSITREIGLEKVRRDLGIAKKIPSMRTYDEACRWLRRRKYI